ncbi:MAG: BolA family transcriptional regulator [Rhizobiaceae bacterium]|nr:BolA family transcriptional regulator [Rhizobiaceae bacterium]
MPQTPTPITDAITTRLTEAFAPIRFEVINESHMHAGHQEKFNGRGETHFRVRIESAAFAGRSRVERHRAITALLREEMAGELHALAIEAAAPGEPTRW